MLAESDLRRATVALDLGHVLGVKRVDVARWRTAATTETGAAQLTDHQRERLDILHRAFAASGERTGTALTVAWVRVCDPRYPDTAPDLRQARCTDWTPQERAVHETSAARVHARRTGETPPDWPAIDRAEQHAMRPDTGACPRCGQTMIARDTVCGACRDADRAPQGDALHLFEMAAAPAPRQEGSLF